MLKSFINNPCNLYFTLWSAYLLQGTLYESSSLLSQGILVMILLMSLKSFWRILLSIKKPYVIKGFSILMVMYIVYGLLLILFDGRYTQGISFHPATTTYLKGYLISILPVFVCYDYAEKGYLNRRMLAWWVSAFVIVSIAGYFREQRERLIDMFEGAETTNNSGYTFLSLIPVMLIFVDKPLLRYFGVALCSIFVLMSMKRGAILILVLVLVVFILNEMKQSKGHAKFITIALLLIFSFFLIHFVQDVLLNSIYFNQRIEETVEGNTSGRNELYSKFIDAFFNDAGAFQILFGRGADGTLKVASNYAHSDWLEILTNQGLLGFFVFCYFWISYIRTINDKQYCDDSRFVLFLVFIILSIKTFFSMSIGGMTIYVCSILGYALADGFSIDQKRTAISIV